MRDETPAGRMLAEMELELPETVTLRELISIRVREEVARHNASGTTSFRGLIRPHRAAESRDGSYRVDPGRRIDWVEQADVAVEAFSKNGFFVLVGDRQVEDLDRPLALSEASDVAFVRLVALVGG